MAQWRCKVGGRECGPFDDDQLRTMAADGRLTPSDKVWNPGSKRWDTANRLRGLFDGPVQTAAARPTDAARRASLAGGAGASPRAFAHQDVGPFVRLRDSFALSAAGKPGALWRGGAVVSPHALYLLKGIVHMMADGGVMAGGTDADVRSCRLAEMPGDLRAALDPNGWFANGDVIIFPRRAVSHVRYSSFLSGITVVCGDDSVRLPYFFFSLPARRATFEKLGWTFGREVEPVGEPLHGSGLGRTSDEQNPNDMTTSQRWRAFLVLGAMAAGALLFRYLLGEGPIFP